MSPLLQKITTVLEHIKVPDPLHVEFLHDPRGFVYLQVTCPQGIDNVTGDAYAWRGRKWYISEHATVSEIVQTAFKAYLTAIEHEAREQFLWKGQPVFDPHYDLDKLAELRSRPDALKEREPRPELVSLADGG